MKNKSASHLILTGLFVVLVLAASHSLVRAQECQGTSNWIGGTGGWFVGTNWSSGCVPSVTIDATINNGGHAQIHGPLNNHAAAESLVLGDNEGDSGSLTIDGDHSAVLDIGGPCRGTIYVGNRGSGNLTITDEGYIRSRYGYVGAVANSNQPTSSSVSVKGQGTTWYLYDYFGEPGCNNAGLFIGCTANSDNGGTATVDVSDGAMIAIRASEGSGVKVGLSGTLTGNGVVYMDGSIQGVEVHGTLAPAGALEIRGNLNLGFTTANTVCHVTPTAWDSVQVTDGTGGGLADLGGRLTVIITGTFTYFPRTFTLLHADAGLGDTKFAFESISLPPGGGCISAEIQYDTNDVNLVLTSSCN